MWSPLRSSGLVIALASGVSQACAVDVPIFKAGEDMGPLAGDALRSGPGEGPPSKPPLGSMPPRDAPSQPGEPPTAPPDMPPDMPPGAPPTAPPDMPPAAPSTLPPPGECVPPICQTCNADGTLSELLIDVRCALDCSQASVVDYAPDPYSHLGRCRIQSAVPHRNCQDGLCVDDDDDGACVLEQGPLHNLLVDPDCGRITDCEWGRVPTYIYEPLGTGCGPEGRHGGACDGWGNCVDNFWDCITAAELFVDVDLCADLEHEGVRYCHLSLHPNPGVFGLPTSCTKVCRLARMNCLAAYEEQGHCGYDIGVPLSCDQVAAARVCTCIRPPHER